jgi:dGTPase
MLDWKQLLNEERRKKSKSGQVEKAGTGGTRVQAERDYDRILFANPTRRLADKTQVFPLEINDSIRTRLTHSMEVSNLCRSIGVRLAFDHAEQVFGPGHEALNVKRSVPALLAAIGLAHDLGNPPFGHQGEEAVRYWFSNHGRKALGDAACHQDFLSFDGNPQTFRLLTRLQILNDDFGLNLSYGTLAALVKYPWFSTSGVELTGDKNKFGIFESEREVAEDVWEKTGLGLGIRHPLTYVMEACDDMAYSVLDAEDTVKKGYASFYDLMDCLSAGSSDPVVKAVVDASREQNEEFKQQGLSSAEMNEVSMQMFRVHAIYQFVAAVTSTFIKQLRPIMSGTLPPGWELIKNSPAAELKRRLIGFDREHGYTNRQVYRLELAGHNTIIDTMDMLWVAITDGQQPFSRYAGRMISENYRRVWKRSSQEKAYKDCQLLADSLSGMTDKYLITMHKDLQHVCPEHLRKAS